MSGDPLDLDAIEAAALADDGWWSVPVLALVAEVRRLRARDATAVRLVRLLRSQVHRLWAYHDWVDGHECSAPGPDDGMEFARIVITRCLMEDGEDRHSVEATSGMSLIEALGMLRLAESTLLEFPPGADDDGEDEA